MKNNLKTILLTDLLDSSSDDESEEAEYFFNSSTSSSTDFLSDSEDSDESNENEECLANNAPPPPVHEVEDFMEIIDAYNDNDFISKFKMQRSTVEYLSSNYSLSDIIPASNHGGKTRLGGRKEVYIYVYYLSNKISFDAVSSLFGVSKSGTWLAVGRVSKWLITFGQQFVHWPTGDDALQNQRRFNEKGKLPGVIGVINCCNIRIRAPKFRKSAYIHRKDRYSIILQAVVNPDKQFIDLYCGEPGSTHKGQVLERSELFSRAQAQYADMFPDKSFVVGGDAYPPTRWLVPPYEDNGQLADSQMAFNSLLSKTSAVAEDTFTQLIRRFAKLTDMKDQSSLPAITNVVVSACVLHNICNVRGDNYIPEEEDKIKDNIQPCSIKHVSLYRSQENRRKSLLNYLLEKNII